MRLRFEIQAILLHLIALAEDELLLIARGPSVGNVNEDNRRLAQQRQLAHVRHDRIRGSQIDTDGLRGSFGVENIEQHESGSEQVVRHGRGFVQEAAVVPQLRDPL